MKFIATVTTLLLLTYVAHAQVATYSPMNARFSDSITLYFNLNASTDTRSSGLLNQTSGLYLWMGAGTEANPFQYTPASQQQFSKPVPGAALQRVGNNLWQITLHPLQWCRVPAGQTITVLGLLVKNADGTAQTENIILKEQTLQTLQQVVVKANKPLVEKQADKTVLNIQNDIVSSGGTVFEALQKAPGVNISNDETINMSGKSGVLVMIDGRPTQLSERDLANWLKATPASIIATIELISNPSGKYDAQGNAGIINIRLKRNTQTGLNGNANSSYTQAQHYRASISSNLNYRKDKLNLYGNLAYNNNLQHTTGSIERQINTGVVQKQFLNNTLDIDRGQSFNLRLGADYYINKKNTFGLLLKGNDYHNPMQTPGTTFIQSNGITDSALRTQNSNTFRTVSHGINLNYRWQDTSGAEWNIDADYTRFNNRNTGNIETDLINKNGQPYGYTANQQRVQTGIHIYAIKADYSRTIQPWKLQLETGAKLVQSATNNDMQAAIWQNTQLQPDTGRSNDFTYREDIYAAYLNLKKTMGKWQMQAGIRAEATNISGRSVNLKGDINPKPDTQYLNLFPSLFVRYAINDNNSIGLNASRRINRPSYQDLNPFENIYDNYTSEKGNPFLRPSYLSNVELNYIYRGALDVTIGYSHTGSYFQTVSEQNGELTTATPYNIGTQHNWFANTSLGLPLTKWWFSYNSVNVFYNQYAGQIPEGNIDNRAWGMGWYTQQSFSLPKEWKLQLSSWGNSGTSDALFRTSWLGSVDAGVSKSWLNGKWNVRVTMYDMFNTQRWQQQVSFGNMNFTYLRKWESRGLRLQFNWKFGKTSFSARKRSTGSETEEGRIKTKS